MAPEWSVWRAAAVLAAGGLFASWVTRSSADDNVLVVQVTGFRDDAGQAGCAIFAASSGFPKEVARATATRFVRVDRRTATCTFEGLAPGVYATVGFHDANGNRVVDTNFLGMPTEGIGVSRDARGTFGPPKFGDAAFRYAGGRAAVGVALHYL